MSQIDELVFRESAFAWLRARMLNQPTFSRDELSQFEFNGTQVRLTGTQTGIWKPAGFLSSLSILTAYVDDEEDRPYEDKFAEDGFLRYKWRGPDPIHADNRGLRSAMKLGVPMIWLKGVGHKPGTRTQVFHPVFPIYLIAEEPHLQQFVVAFEESQRHLVEDGLVVVNEIERRYNQTIARQRLHQPVFRASVINAYKCRCAVCRLPFHKLLDAAHIIGDAQGGEPKVNNGLSLCKIHHGAYDTNILGIDPDYTVHINRDVLETFDGPTLQHAIKEMDNQRLMQLPESNSQLPDRDKLGTRFEEFLRFS